MISLRRARAYARPVLRRTDFLGRHVVYSALAWRGGIFFLYETRCLPIFALVFGAYHVGTLTI